MKASLSLSLVTDIPPPFGILHNGKEMLSGSAILAWQQWHSSKAGRTSDQTILGRSCTSLPNCAKVERCSPTIVAKRKRASLYVPGADILKVKPITAKDG